MKRITIIVPENQNALSTIACLAAAYEVFYTANKYIKEKGNNQSANKKVYTVELAGVSKKEEVNDGLFAVKPQVQLADISRTNLIVIPSTMIRSFEKPTKGNRFLIDWLEAQYKKGAEIATMCSGAFLLASTGLLDGKRCSTHWAHANNFRAMFPKVNLQADQLITDEHGIYTNGGAYSFLNLLIYLVEKYYDRQTAIYCAKIFQIEMDRNSQSAFSIFTGQKLHGDAIIQQAQLYIEERLDERISVEHLSSKFAVGRRNFDRRFIKATGNTPVEYAQRVKIESAKKAFEATNKNINEVMYEVGYSDAKAFREVFRKITGMSPLEYRKKYNKEALAR